MGAPELKPSPAVRRITRTVVVANPPMGLHVRPAAAFAKLVRGFKCSVTLSHGAKRADGRSAFDLLGLLAEPGTELVVEIEGEDADSAVGPLCDILTAEGEPSETPGPLH
jgi:phosphotransferase system HPr (HPr) family protein